MQETLTRDDIVGKKIQHIWQTPWKLYQEENDPSDYVEYCLAYVELDDNTIFEIQWQDNFEELPIKRYNSIDKDWLETVDSALGYYCYDMTVVEVLTAKRIPTFCLLLSNNSLLYASDYGPYQTGPLTSKIGEKYPIENFATYWGHKKLMWEEKYARDINER